MRGLISVYLFTVLIISAAFQVVTASAQPDFDPVAALRGMKDAYVKVEDYTAIFIKQELVKDELLPEETIRFKFKKPFMVYMGWMEGPHEGREALFVRGRNEDQVTGHEGGFFGFVTLDMDPNGSMAMRGNRHPITDVGIGRLIDIVSDNVERALNEGVNGIRETGMDTVFGRDAWYIDCALPPDEGYYGGRIRIWIDRANGLPIKIMIYGWDDRLWESYGYKDLVLNPGLSGDEFSEDYEGYDF